jgi:uncharacterized membrane protein YeiB
MINPVSTYAPTGEGERLVHIDVLRSIALLGVLLINIDAFSGAFWAVEAHVPYPMGWGGSVLFFLRRALVEGKAVALLSILFGAGMMMQMERAQSRSRSYGAFALRRLFIAGAAIGLAANLLPLELVVAWTGVIPFRPLRVLLKMIYFFGRPMLAVGFLSGLLLLLRKPPWLEKTTVLAPLGRMALSQYLLQSLACSLVFYGFGLGLLGKVPLDLCIAGSLAFFALQAWSSRLWLEHFHMGPAEWLWRSLAYGSRPRFRRAAD